MRNVQAAQPPADAVLDLMNRISPAELEVHCRENSLTNLSPELEFLRQTVRESQAVDDNFADLLAYCSSAGMSIGRRGSFRAGVTLGLLVGEVQRLQEGAAQRVGGPHDS